MIFEGFILNLDSFGRTFVRPPGTKSLNCQKFFNHDRRYVYRYTKKRLNFTDPPDESLPMDCESIRMRNYFPRFPATKIEADYPLAEARVVFQISVRLNILGRLISQFLRIWNRPTSLLVFSFIIELL